MGDRGRGRQRRESREGWDGREGQGKSVSGCSEGRLERGRKGHAPGLRIDLTMTGNYGRACALVVQRRCSCTVAVRGAMGSA